MRRLTILFLLAALAGTTTAWAQPVATVYIPPFTNAGGLGSARLISPCSPSASPVTALAPKPAEGSLDSSEGVAATRCRAVSGSTDRRFTLGDVPAGLIGARARITAVLHVEATRLVARGTGSRAASLTLAIAGGPAWTLARIACTSSCTSRALPNGDQTLETTVASLPATLQGLLSTSASLRNASGAIGAEIRATLRSVTITPA